MKSRSPDLIYVPRRPHFFGSFSVVTHSGPWDYLQKVPLVFYGPGLIQGRGGVDADRPVTVADVAPTLARLIGTDFPSERPGRGLDAVLVPDDERPEPPRVVVVVVWDGGGWSVLNSWPRAWPNLRRMMRGGASLRGATVGSSPSVTPAIHATLGTGAFPRTHGIVNIPQRDGTAIVNSTEGLSPRLLELPTLADLYDRSVGNEALVGMIAFRPFHLGMMGHGAFTTGGDRDIAVVTGGTPDRIMSNPRWYSMPGYLRGLAGWQSDFRAVDGADGRLDGRWLGNDLNRYEILRRSPVVTRYLTRQVKAILDREGFGRDEVPDLFFVNYKAVDEVGHYYFRSSPEMRQTLRYTDRALGELASHLDEQVGKKRWALVMTADHGHSPDPIKAGAWPIKPTAVQAAIAGRFNVSQEDLILDHQAGGAWLDHGVMARKGITPGRIANFLLDYRIVDDAYGSVPSRYADRSNERLFSAVIPAAHLDRVLRCAARR